MKPRNNPREIRHHGWAWWAAPLSTVAAVLGAIMIISWPPPPGATLAKAALSEAPPSAGLRAGVHKGHPAQGLTLFSPPSELDALRDNATLGDPIAGIALVRQLLDNFERTGRGDDLYEAVQWMDRSWADGHFQTSGLPTRVFEQYCDYGALRWHWLCEAGE